MDRKYVVAGLCFVLVQLSTVSTDHIIVPVGAPKLSEFHQARVKVQQLQSPTNTEKSPQNDLFVEYRNDPMETPIEESSVMKTSLHSNHTNQIENHDVAHFHPIPAEASSTSTSSRGSEKTHRFRHNDIADSHPAMNSARGTDQTIDIDYNYMYPINDAARSDQVLANAPSETKSSDGTERTSRFEQSDYHPIKDVTRPQQELHTLSLNTPGLFGTPNKDKNGIKKNTVTDFVGDSSDTVGKPMSRVSTETPRQNKNDINTAYQDHFVNDEPKVFDVPMSEYVGKDAVTERLDAGLSNSEGSKWQNLVYKLLNHIMEKPNNVNSNFPQTIEENKDPTNIASVRPKKSTDRNNGLSQFNQKLFGMENNEMQVSRQRLPSKGHKKTPELSYDIKASRDNREDPVSQHSISEIKNKVQRQFGILSPIIFVLTGDKCKDASHNHNAKIGSTGNEKLFATVKKSIEPLLGYAKDVKVKKKPAATTPKSVKQSFEALVDTNVEKIHNHVRVHDAQTTTSSPILVLNKDYGRDVIVHSPLIGMKAKQMKLKESHQPNTRSESLRQRVSDETEVKPDFHSSPHSQTNIATNRLYPNEPKGMREIVVQTLPDKAVGNDQHTPKENVNVVVTKLNSDMSRRFQPTYDTKTAAPPRTQSIHTNNNKMTSSVSGPERINSKQVNVNIGSRQNEPRVPAHNEAARQNRPTSRKQDVNKTPQSPEQRRAVPLFDRQPLNSQSSPNMMPSGKLNNARHGDRPTMRFQPYNPHRTRNESDVPTVRRPTDSMSRRIGGPQVRPSVGSNKIQSEGSNNRWPGSSNNRQFRGPRVHRPASQNNRLSVNTPGRLSASPRTRLPTGPYVGRPAGANFRQSDGRSLRGPISPTARMPEGHSVRTSARSNARQSVQRSSAPRNRRFEGPFARRSGHSNTGPTHVQSAKDMFSQNNRLSN